VVLHELPGGAKQKTLLAGGPAINCLAFGGPAAPSLLVAGNSLGAVMWWDFGSEQGAATPAKATLHNVSAAAARRCHMTCGQRHAAADNRQRTAADARVCPCPAVLSCRVR
jgi:hypothetical protein